MPHPNLPAVRIGIALFALFLGLGSAAAQTAEAPLATKTDAEEGTYLVAGDGYAVYLFKADRQGANGAAAESRCQGDCLATWPALVATGDPVGTDALDASLLGTVTRDDGILQVTYNGWPLYYYAGDSTADDITGHDIESFGEDWYLIGPNGERARD